MPQNFRLPSPLGTYPTKMRIVAEVAVQAEAVEGKGVEAEEEEEEEEEAEAGAGPRTVRLSQKLFHLTHTLIQHQVTPLNPQVQRPMV